MSAERIIRVKSYESSDSDKRSLARQLTEEFFQFMANNYKAQSEGGHMGKADDRERTIVSYGIDAEYKTNLFGKRVIKSTETKMFPAEITSVFIF